MKALKLIKKFIPKTLLLKYHYLLAIFFNWYCRYPSRKIIVVGITGTNGKTSTSILLRDILQASSVKTGLIGTAQISIGEDIKPNDKHATMIGRGFIQKQLRKMVDVGCKVAIIETTSEGIKEHRQIGIEYDILLFTNLTPEHLESHGGSFEKYKETKLKIFKDLHNRYKKNIPKTIIVNSDDPHSSEFINNTAEQKLSFGINSGDLRAENVSVGRSISFSLDGKVYKAPLIGRFNVYNALGAVAIAKVLSVDDEQIVKGLEKTKGIPGRMELIDEGQEFSVFVDYAHEGEGLRNALTTLQDIRKNNKLISIVGGVGGGRDKRNRFEIGKVASELSDIVVVTNVDPYEDDPLEIINDVVNAAVKNKSVLNQNLFAEENRRDGIAKAFSLARDGDVVIVTGKGAELTMMVPDGHIAWDERKIVRNILRSSI